MAKRCHVFYLFLFLSLLFHGSVIFFTPINTDKSVPVITPKQVISHVKIIEKKRQIVDTNDNGEKIENDARFFGKENMRFDQQKIARRIGEFKKGLSFDPYERLKNSKVGAGFKKDEVVKELAQRSDYVKDIELSDVTELNTSQYRFYSYIARFKKQMEGQWREKVQRYFKTRTNRRMPASISMLETNLIINLDQSGTVMEVKIDKSCGIKAIDEIAVNSIRSVGAFPNPPRGMAQNGKITIPFGFVLE